MLRLAVLATAIVAFSACRQSLEDNPDASSVDAPPSPACQEATTYQNLANIESKIFKTSCIFSGCHNGAQTDAGRIDLREGKAHPQIVMVSSLINSGFKMVEPMQPKKSWLLFMMGHIPADQMIPPVSGGLPNPPGIMPQGAGGMPLCKEKRDAIERWITAGAANN
jgi:hypothetical protein